MKKAIVIFGAIAVFLAVKRIIYRKVAEKKLKEIVNPDVSPLIKAGILHKEQQI